ncbi:EamA family transporter [Cesiribacter sp. SM1]|uniref:EamA family transporter n=1 Tax=Cesiribacter sp. SM1 TaxID=2861196 RepID=UPI001CD374BC|nr:EamA family transporter [Cesiribacter sp. SM1]
MGTSNTKAYLALIFICVVWGTTYLALRIGVEGFPPFLFSGIRQAVAGSMLLLFLLLFRRKFEWRWKTVQQQIVPGILMIGFGNGLVGWAEMYIPSGLAALLCSLMPLFVVLINLSSEGAAKLNWKIISGLMTGLLGMAVIFQENLHDLMNRQYFLGILFTCIAAFSWAFGSILNKRRSAGADPFYNASLQMISGGVFMLLLSLLFDDLKGVSMTQESFYALIYLIVFGSIGAFIAYLYALTKLPVGLVSVYAYVNPLVAVLLGYVILNEKLNEYTIVAFVLIVLGVYLVNWGYRSQTIVKKKLGFS